MHALPPWLSKLSAVALLAGILLLFVVYAISPIVERHRELRDDLAHSGDMITHLSAAGERRELLVKQIEVLERSVIDSGLLLQSETEPLAAAELRETVKRIIGRTGGELQSSQNLTASDVEGFKRIAIRVALRANIQQFVPLLYELEAQRPYLFVETLEIKSRVRRSRQNRERSDETPLLMARFDIYGYILSERGQ